MNVPVVMFFLSGWGLPGGFLINPPCSVDDDKALAKVNFGFVPEHLAPKQDGVVHVRLIIRCWQVAGSECVGPVKVKGMQGQVRLAVLRLKWYR